MMTMPKAGSSACEDPDALDYGSDDDGAPAATPRTVIGRPVAAQRPMTAPCSASRGSSFLDRLVDNVGLCGGSSSR